MLISYGLCFSPDSSGKPGAEKPVFCRQKKATAGSLFYGMQKRFFCEDLKRIAGIATGYFSVLFSSTY